MSTNRNHLKPFAGFTLVEIALILAVLAILAVIAVPYYKDYVIKSRVVEAFEMADAARIQVLLKAWDGNNDALTKGFNALEKPVDHVTTLRWVPVNSNKSGKGDAIIGYLLPAMNLPELGMRDAFALEYLSGGAWRCVNAAQAKDRNLISQNEALEDKYLPAYCHAGGGFMAPHPKAPPGCPQGTQLTQAKDANGKMQQICQSPTPTPQPNPQPSLPPQPGVCPIGQDCTHKDPKCPPGQEYFAGGQIPVRANFDPWNNGAAVFSTQSMQVAAGCVAKCQKGFVFNPKTPSSCGVAGATNHHVCHGPKFICERAHGPEPACPADAPYAANHVHNLSDGSRYVTRSCVTQNEAFNADQYNKAHPECKNYSVKNLRAADFKCTFACLGDNCNSETVPPAQANWGKGKTADDLPDGFKAPGATP